MNSQKGEFINLCSGDEMMKKVHINKFNKATFVCPNCVKAKMVDVSKYIGLKNRTKVKSKCTCGCSWTSILERRKHYRMTVDIPCVCSQVGPRGLSEGVAMRIADLSSSGIKIKPHQYGTIKTSDYFFAAPILVDFYLKGNSDVHIRKTATARYISESCMGAEFDDSEKWDHNISAYLLGQKYPQAIR